MTIEDFKELTRGSIVRHKMSSDSYVVTAHYGDRVTVVRTIDMTQPHEWDYIGYHGDEDEHRDAD